MGEMVFIGLWHLRTLFGNYEQFISVLWNYFYWQCSKVFMEQRPDSPARYVVKIHLSKGLS